MRVPVVHCFTGTRADLGVGLLPRTKRGLFKRKCSRYYTPRESRNQIRLSFNISRATTMKVRDGTNTSDPQCDSEEKEVAIFWQNLPTTSNVSRDLLYRAAKFDSRDSRQLADREHSTESIIRIFFVISNISTTSNIVCDMCKEQTTLMFQRLTLPKTVSY